MVATQRFAGKVAIITGASSGMGLATAAQLAREGAKVVLVSRTQDKLDAAAAKIRAEGGDVTTVAADVGKDESNAAMVETALSKYGRLDIAFLNAGAYVGVPFEQVLETNVKSVALGFKHVLPAIKGSGGGGSVVVNSSVVGGHASAHPSLHGSGLYAASKAAVEMLVRFAAVEAADFDTRVNAIAPGVVQTAIFGEGAPDAAYEDLAKAVHLMPRPGRPEEVAAFVCFLASAEASFVTGSVHLADGGMSIRM